MSNYTVLGLLESYWIRKPKTDVCPSISYLSILRKAILALVLIASFSIDSYASHDRGGTLTWQQAGGNTIRFTLNASWRRSFPFPGYSPTNLPVVGSLVDISAVSVFQFGFGDGSFITTSMLARVTSVDAAEDLITTTYTVDHTYANAGNYTVFYANCCRLSTLLDGNRDANFRIETIANVGSPFNSPPVSSFPPVISISTGQAAATFIIPFNDPDGNAVTFRPATTAECGLPRPVPVGFAVSSAGVATFNTQGLAVNNLYAVQLMMSDGRTKVAVDFIIEIVPPSQPPVFINPTPLSPNNVFNVLPGNNISFPIAARDNDAGQIVTLSPVDIPVGSFMSPALPVSGAVNGTATSTFNWVPTSTQIGTYVITFIAVDNFGVQRLTSVSVRVLCPLSTTITSTRSTTCPSSSDGAADISVQNFSSTANLLYSWTGPNSFVSNTQDISNVRAGNYSIRVTDNANGCFNITPVTIGATPDAIPPVVSCPANIPCVEATSPAGAVVYYAPPTATDNCGSATVTSVQTSGSVFPLGLNVVVATAVDASGNSSSCSFTVQVCDRTPPVIHNTPADIPCIEATSAAGAVVTYISPTATDIADGNVSVTCVPASGSTFPIGTSTVVCTAVDAYGNSASTSFTVSVCDNTPPAIQNTPSNIPCIEATSAAGAVVTYTSPTAVDIVDGNVPTFSVLPSGSTFPIGVSTVVSTATDAHGNSTSTSFTINVCDATPPVITCPNNITVGATSTSGAVVTYPSSTATDIVDGNVAAFSLPVSGSVFAIGTTTVISTATDMYGNSASCSFTVTVINTPPVISCPANVPCVEATSAAGAVVTFPAATATDFAGASVATTSIPASGSVFPIGTSTVIFSATDYLGLSATCSFTVTVCDNTPPVIACAAPLSINTNAGNCSAVVTFPAVTATDNVSATILQTGGLGSGATYPIGTTTNTFQATDPTGNSSSCSFTVTVKDVQKPTITAPANITVCNGGTVTLGTATATDNCSVASITNNAPVSYPSGTTTIVWTATDIYGNTTTATQTVTISVITMGTPSVSNVKCYGGSDGSVTVSATGGTNTFTYKRSGSLMTNTTGVFTGLTAGTYTFTATDGFGCTAQTTATVQQNPPVSVNAGNCQFVYYGYGSNCVTLSAQGSGGTGSFTYKWNPGNLSGSSVQVCPIVTTTYTVTATDQNGCTSTSTVKVEVIDVRCGNKNDKVSICHNGNVLCVAASAIPAHLAHGDKLGSCGTPTPCGAGSNIAMQPNTGVNAVHTEGYAMDMILYPNPAQNTVNLNLDNMTEGNVTIQILDMTGRIIQNKQQTVTKGYNSMVLDMAQMPTGLYLVKVQSSNQQPMARKLQISK